MLSTSTATRPLRDTVPKRPDGFGVGAPEDDEFEPVYDRDGCVDRVGGIGTRIPYSSYQYVLGATGALAVRDRLRDGSLSPREYRQFLRQTGRKPPLESFSALHLDLHSAGPFERATATFDRYLDDL